MDYRSEKTKKYLESYIEEIMNLIEQRTFSISNRQLVKICRKGRHDFDSNIDPHFFHEIAETALNRVIKDKYAVRLLRSSAPELCAKEVLRPLAEMLLAQTWRSIGQIVRQQFSTPPAIAYLLVHLLKLQANEVALEPSAGTGSLAAWTSGFGIKTHTNEIDERRNLLLKYSGFNPKNFNAELINDFLPTEIIPDVVVMNPPFSSSGGRTKNNSSKFGFRHVESALERLKKGGKLGVILGEAGGLDTKTGNDFWRKLSDRIEVGTVIKIDGREYSKNGTTVDINLIIGKKFSVPQKTDWNQALNRISCFSVNTVEEAFAKVDKFNPSLNR